MNKKKLQEELSNLLIRQQENNDKLNTVGKKLYDYFTSNDIVGSLGELLFYNKLFRKYFEKIEISKLRKNKCDFIAYKDKKAHKIEVKSRYMILSGNPVLSHVIPGNFNFLVFILFKENYKVHYWCILSAEQVKKTAKKERLKISSELNPLYENRKFKLL